MVIQKKKMKMEFGSRDLNNFNTRSLTFEFVFLKNLYLPTPGLIVAHRIFSCSTWDLALSPGIEPGPPHWQYGEYLIKPRKAAVWKYTRSNMAIGNYFFTLSSSEKNY